jgi:hypothetical protein
MVVATGATLANVIFFISITDHHLTIQKAKHKLSAGTRITKADFVLVPVYTPDLRGMKALVVEANELSAFAAASLAETVEPG